jgi:hypothetical protein
MNIQGHYIFEMYANIFESVFRVKSNYPSHMWDIGLDVDWERSKEGSEKSSRPSRAISQGLGRRKRCVQD